MPDSTTDHRRSSRPDLYAEVTDRIIAALEAGTAPWVRPWSTNTDGAAQRNGASGHVYKGINTVLTAMAGFASARWYTFAQAKALGGHVRKGEHGTKIAFWKFVEAKGADHEGEDGSEVEGGESNAAGRRTIPILRCYVVFNAEQFEWPSGSAHAVVEHEPVGGEHDSHDRAAALVAASGATVVHQGVRACYQPTADRIVMPAPSRFEDAAAYDATLLHELAHWTGHASRLDRNLSGRFGSDSYAAEELVAELAAAFLCADLGIDGRLQHAEYIGSWLRVLRGDKRAIFTASRLAQQAADFLTAKVGQVEGDVGTTGLKEAA